jgi:AcrR family transcriptional regulator
LCSTESHQAILDAAVELLEVGSLRTLTIEAIATKAQVSKQTVYKWWPTKSALVMEAYAGSFGEFTPSPDTGDFAADLREFTRRSLRTLNRPSMMRPLTGLLAEAQFDEGVRTDMRDRFLVSRRHHWHALFKRGISRGQVRADVDVELCLDLLFGPIWMRMLFRHGKLDMRLADTVSNHVLRSIAPPDL